MRSWYDNSSNARACDPSHDRSWSKLRTAGMVTYLPPLGETDSASTTKIVPHTGRRDTASDNGFLAARPIPWSGTLVLGRLGEVY